MKTLIYKKSSPAFIFAAMILTLLLFNVKPTLSQVPLMDPDTIPKFLDELPIPSLMNPALETSFTVGMYPIQQQYHANWPLTTMWGYGRSQATASSPARTIAAVRGVPDTVTWENHLVDNAGNFLVHPLDIDQTIPWANPLGSVPPPTTRYNGPVPTVVHLHGGEVLPTADGHYSGWFTPQGANVPVITGPTYNTLGTGVNHQTYTYSNEQPAATIWYHDHAFGIDRLNVMMGLFGGYAIVDPNDGIEHIPAFGVNGGIIPTLPPYDFPVIIQDRQIDVNYQIAYRGEVTNPDVHPIWFPEFFGNIIVVNGKVWPYKNVEQTIYRFRLLNGSNARFYHLYFSDGTPEYDEFGTFVRYRPIDLPFLQIASDGGFLENAVQINDFLQAPAERIEVLVDFANFAEGTDIYLVNDAAGPYPSGDPVDANTAMIMKFHVVPVNPNYDDSYVRYGVANGTRLKPVVTRPAPILERNVVLFEKQGPGGPLAMFLDGIDMSDPRSTYKPVLGTVEKWNIINTTMDAHPMHWHLTQLQLLGRQSFANYMMDLNGNMIPDPSGYLEAFRAANPILPIPYDAQFNPVDISPFITGAGTAVSPGEEKAMKDTWVCPPSEVTSFLIKWTQENDQPYSFNAALSPGYVWHCHILEHEENSMMREIQPVKPEPSLNKTNLVLWLDGAKQQAYGPVDYTNMMPMLNQWTDYSGLNNNAVQTIMDNQPMFDGYGVSYKHSVMFDGNMNPLTADRFVIPYAASITTSNVSPSKPVVDNKDLYIVFKLNSLTGRQTIFEAGGKNSGFNIYAEADSLVCGFWTNTTYKTQSFPVGTLKQHVAYLAHLEYRLSNANNKFRFILNGVAAGTPKAFKGLIVDGTDSTGIGGVASTTRFADGTFGSNSDSFTGDIAEVLLFNNFDTTQKANVYGYLNWKYDAAWSYPVTSFVPKLPEVAENDVIPNDVQLTDAYPNPADNSTLISYSLPNEAKVSLRIYDILGNEVAAVFDGIRSSGYYQEKVNTENLSGGMYFYKFSADNFVQTKSFVVVR